MHAYPYCLSPFPCALSLPPQLTILLKRNRITKPTLLLAINTSALPTLRTSTPHSTEPIPPPSSTSKNDTRPNTSIHYPLFTPHSLPMPTGRLKLEGWAKLMALYPDSEVTSAIMGICKFGVRIGYEGIREEPTIYPNLASAEADIDLVTANIAYELSLDRLHTYPNQESLPTHYTASPLGLTDKSAGSKRRIHHLSYPTTGTSSINAGIPEEYGTVAYSGINDAILAIQNMGTGSLLIKRDFESAFRHIPVSPLDSPLLGFQWQGRYYSECFLPFGLRTAPYLFNLFSEAFHWILQEELGTQELPGRIIHYLDDFLIVIPPDSNPTNYTRVFAKLCTELGLSIKESKNKEGTTVDFAGVELDTRRMVIRLPMKKLLKGREIVDSTIEKKSISLLELQQITGYLTFASTVVPLGRTFLRPLYNLQIYFPRVADTRGGASLAKRIRTLLGGRKYSLMRPKDQSLCTPAK